MKAISSLEFKLSRGRAHRKPLSLRKQKIFSLMLNAFLVFFIVALAAFTLSIIEGVVYERTVSDDTRTVIHKVLGIETASAASLHGFETEKVMGSIHVALTPGETRTVTFGFMNRGSKSWTRDGVGFVSLYTYGPKYRESAFVDTSWYRNIQPTRLKQSSVLPGQVGYFEFELTAPNQPGQYYETFHLAAEDIAWIPGGELMLNIPVSGETIQVTTPTSDPEPAPSESVDGLSAMLLLKSESQVTARGGESIDFTVGIKNTGTKTWITREIRVPDIYIAADSSDTTHSSWVSSTKVVTLTSNPVSPGALDLISFTFTAPRTSGNHTIRYAFAANDVEIPDFYIDIPVEVTGSSSTNSTTQTVNERDLIDEPIIRVGVLIVDEETDWQVEVSCESDWELKSGSGHLLGEMDAGEMVRAFYKEEEAKYYFNRGKGLEKTSDYLRFVPEKENAICTIENFDRRITRNAGHADNTFRNILEIRWNDAKDRVWMINELSMEYYLRGLAETSNYSHEEFQKALITVARTYALYHFERGTKRGPEHYTIGSSADDQVYKGYGQETRTPRLTNAVEDTRGVVVTYDGETAITPYFSRSDGRTRDWSEVWYGDVAWAKSVPVPCDIGKTLWGHGVGLSASGALCMANDGDDWDYILKYFYTGIALDRHWK